MSTGSPQSISRRIVPAFSSAESPATYQRLPRKCGSSLKLQAPIDEEVISQLRSERESGKTGRYLPAGAGGKLPAGLPSSNGFRSDSRVAVNCVTLKSGSLKAQPPTRALIAVASA